MTGLAIAPTFALLLACSVAVPDERRLVKEDYQVLQRDANDRTLCMAALPAGTSPMPGSSSPWSEMAVS